MKKISPLNYPHPTSHAIIFNFKFSKFFCITVTFFCFWDWPWQDWSEKIQKTVLNDPIKSFSGCQFVSRRAPACLSKIRDHLSFPTSNEVKYSGSSGVSWGQIDVYLDKNVIIKSAKPFVFSVMFRHVIQLNLDYYF